jgi:steroid delta-isomerase-like uncharacterized protein
MVTDTPAQLTRRFIEEALNGRNLDVIDELIAEDYEELDPMPNQLPGRQGVRDVFQSLLHAFPDLHWEILEQISEGNKVVTRCVWTGTQENDLGGIPATGKRVELKSITIDEWENGMMVRSRFMNDDLEMQRQLGLLPPSTI